jgi:hypothetical protein
MATVKGVVASCSAVGHWCSAGQLQVCLHGGQRLLLLQCVSVANSCAGAISAKGFGCMPLPQQKDAMPTLPPPLVSDLWHAGLRPCGDVARLFPLDVACRGTVRPTW